eukprot:TRINITY_DN3325_c0_g1_i1.p1 TRINITY_DN3325_c0_g1~~TRINITY_DN3325_c0_g1_i1.p1  ORF type:complete len:225 (+),score=41.65 TRINITY_DN3325_c0_g1_i1:1243-1917(+)
MYTVEVEEIETERTAEDKELHRLEGFSVVGKVINGLGKGGEGKEKEPAYGVTRRIGEQSPCLLTPKRKQALVSMQRTPPPPAVPAAVQPPVLSPLPVPVAPDVVALEMPIATPAPSVFTPVTPVLSATPCPSETPVLSRSYATPSAGDRIQTEFERIKADLEASGRALQHNHTRLTSIERSLTPQTSVPEEVASLKQIILNQNECIDRLSAIIESTPPRDRVIL